MKKMIRKYTTLLLSVGLLSLASLGNNVANHVAQASDEIVGHFIERESNIQEGQPSIKVLSDNPWVNNAQVQLKLETPVQVDKTYLGIDISILKTINNPEAVLKFGVNDTIFTGLDDVDIPGNPTGCRKQWGNWFFVHPGRTTLFIKTQDYLKDITKIESFGIWFDTGIIGRQVELELHGLYLTNDTKIGTEKNILGLDNLRYNEDLNIIDERYTSIGVSTQYLTNKNEDLTCKGVKLDRLMNGAMHIHVKSANEGGKVAIAPEEYGFITFDLSDAPIDVSSDSGIAFKAYAPSGETYVRVYLETVDGSIYKANVSGGDAATAINYPLVYENESIGIVPGFYNAFYLNEGEGGTIYVRYDDFIRVNHFQGKDYDTSKPNNIDKIAKIHLGMDMIFGLGRNVAISEFATCDIENDIVKPLIYIPSLSESEWNRNDINLSTHIKADPISDIANNFIVSVIKDSDVPGYIVPNDNSQLQAAIDSALRFKNKENLYTKESYRKFDSSLISAQNILEFNELYTQDDINKATLDLLAAIRGLKLIANDMSNNATNLNLPMIIGLSVGGAAILIAGISALIIILKKKNKKEGQKNA